MKTILPYLILLIPGLCGAQTYAENLDKCRSNFQAAVQGGVRYDQGFRALRECIIGQTLPAFTMASLDGKQYSQKDLNGKVVLINLWFIGCQPCIAEMPLLSELSKEFHSKDFLLLSFSRDDKNSLQSFLKQNNLPYPVFGDAKDIIEKKFRMFFGYPTSIILDKKGKIIEFSDWRTAGGAGADACQGRVKSGDHEGVGRIGLGSDGLGRTDQQ